MTMFRKKLPPLYKPGVFKVILQATIAMLFSPGYRFLSMTLDSSFESTSSAQENMSDSEGALTVPPQD